MLSFITYLGQAVIYIVNFKSILYNILVIPILLNRRKINRGVRCSQFSVFLCLK